MCDASYVKEVPKTFYKLLGNSFQCLMICPTVKFFGLQKFQVVLHYISWTDGKQLSM